MKTIRKNETDRNSFTQKGVLFLTICLMTTMFACEESSEISDWDITDSDNAVVDIVDMDVTDIDDTDKRYKGIKCLVAGGKFGNYRSLFSF